MRTFWRALVACWLAYVLTVALVLAKPRLLREVPRACTWAYFGGGMVALLVSTLVYKVARAYRAGMSRP